MRIFLDANILFSAAKSAGAVRHLLDGLLDSGHECWVDEFVVTEARRNLELKEPTRITELEAILGRLLSAASGTARPPSLPLPEKDRPVLAAAIRLRCDALVTGDRTHFGPLYGRTFSGVTIHSPRSLWEALLR